MIVLHAGLDRDQFLVWGEASAEGVGRRKRGRAAAPRPHPRDAGAGQLRAALAMVWPANIGPQGGAETALVTVPTIRGEPAPSSPLLAPPLEGATALAPWQVTALPLAPREAVELLCACVGRDTLAPGVVVGATLAYWVHALRLAGALVAREQFVPQVRKNGDGFSATWEPVLAGAEAERRDRLAAAMPPACRALARSAETPPSGSSAALTAFLRVAVDALVRSARGAPPSPASLKPRRRKAAAPAFDSVHDQWAYALAAPDGALAGRPADLGKLAEQVSAWQRPALGATLAPFRLCFRLEEPADPESDPKAGWNVRYLLQARDDPSLIVQAADAWSPGGRLAGVFARRGFQPREYLLLALGQAAALCPGVEDSLRTPAPEGFTLDPGGAHAFLTQRAALLEQAGFGVMLPAWWTPHGARQRLTARAHAKAPKMQGGSGMSLMDLVEFDWQAALGDEVLTPQELRTLAKLKQPLVRFRGQWVEVRPEEIDKLLELWKKKEAGRAAARDLVRMALGGTQAPGGLPVSGVSADGWLGELLGQLEGRSEFVEQVPPTGLRGTLRPYQVRGYSWLGFLRQWGLGACLADDMGLGKTVQTLALLQREREAGEKRPVLLICPTSVLGNWKHEAERFTPDLPVLLHHGLKRAKGDAFVKVAEKHALVLTSYPLLHRDGELLQRADWAGAILDEAQNVKNPETKQAQAARAINAGYRVALTGTPVENHVGDLWSIFEFLNPGLLGGQAEFRRRFFVPIQAGHDPDAAKRLQRLTGPFILRRLKTDKTVVSDLPDKVEMKVYCTLTKEQASLYAAVVAELDRGLDEAEGIQRRGQILGALSKLKQVCNHPAHFLGDNSALAGRSGKLTRLTELLEEIVPSGEKMLLFTQFTEMGELLKSYLQDSFGHEVLFLHGGVQRKQRDALVKRFQTEENGPRVFVLSLKAGGTGLNLTAASHVVHFDRWWNPAVENQATDRAFRLGQTKNVLVHKFVCTGTLEERIDEMIERKQEVAGRVVGSGEAWLTELSNAALRDLVALRDEAVED